MTNIGNFSIVVNANRKVTDKTKVFRMRQQAQEYAGSLGASGEEGYIVLNVKAVLN